MCRPSTSSSRALCVSGTSSPLTLTPTPTLTLTPTLTPTPTLTLTLTTQPSPSPYPGAQSFLSLLHKAQYEGGQPLPAADELPTLLTGFFGRQVRSRYSMAD